MSHSLALAFFVFMVAGLFTPGPNNMMLLTSGLNFGFRRTLPHVVGIGAGFSLLIMITGFGLGAVFKAYPQLYTVLKYAGAAYLVWLAIGIARSGPINGDGAARGAPMTFIGAVLFQWVNAKGWVVAVSAITAYSAIAPYPVNVLVIGVVTLIVGLASAVTWALFGVSLRPLLASPRLVRVFNIVMALALIGSLYPVIWGP